MSLSLINGPCWELEERRVDSILFFRSLAAAFPEATTAFFEGASIASDVVELFQRHVEPGPYLPEPETFLSVTFSGGGVSLDRDLFFRCRFTPDFCEALAGVAVHHAAPELCDHMSLYSGAQPLLEWPDAFSNCIWITHSVPEERVAAFAGCLGLG